MIHRYQSLSLLLQYLILKKNKAAKARNKVARSEDKGVHDTWNFIEKRWVEHAPKMIISVTGGKRQFFMNQRLLRSFKRGLMKAAVASGAR